MLYTPQKRLLDVEERKKPKTTPTPKKSHNHPDLFMVNM